MNLDDNKMWMGLGAGVVIFLIITTPGWKEVLGMPEISLSLSGYAPALILLLAMGGLLGAMLMGGSGGDEE